MDWWAAAVEEEEKDVIEEIGMNKSMVDCIEYRHHHGMAVALQMPKSQDCRFNYSCTLSYARR